MSEQLTVLYVVNGTVAEDVHTAQRITSQMHPGGMLHVRLYTAGELAEYVFYRQAERVQRGIDPAPREERA